MEIRHLHQDPIDPLVGIDEVEWQADHTVTGTKAEFDAACSDGNFVFGVAHPQVNPGSGIVAKLTNVGGGTGTQIGTANQTRMYLYVSPYTMSFASFGINVTTALAASNAKIAIYATDPATGYPTTLLGETTDLDCSTTGFKSAAMPLTLNANTVYALAVRVSGTQTLQSFVSALAPLYGRTSFSNGFESHMQRSITYANPAPNPWVYSASEVQQFTFPWIVAGVI